VTLDHVIGFEVPIAAPAPVAVAFVQDVARSLEYARFLRGLRVDAGPPSVVEASLPINAALFGQRDLPFRSTLTPTQHGARLDGLDVSPSGPGWAMVSGDAVVRASGGGSIARYDLLVTVHVALPEADRWGTRALVRMIEYTAETVLTRLTAAFPEAVARAAHETERALAERSSAGAYALAGRMG
jgi:hypothetical protein